MGMHIFVLMSTCIIAAMLAALGDSLLVCQSKSSAVGLCVPIIYLCSAYTADADSKGPADWGWRAGWSSAAQPDQLNVSSLAL